jgi:hypothetical protein
MVSMLYAMVTRDEAIHLGVALTAVLVPLCAICLLVIFQLGKNAFCAYTEKEFLTRRVAIPLELGDSRAAKTQ